MLPKFEDLMTLQGRASYSFHGGLYKLLGICETIYYHESFDGDVLLYAMSNKICIIVVTIHHTFLDQNTSSDTFTVAEK